MNGRRDHDSGLQELHSAQPFRRFIPNLITIAGFCFGLSAVRFALAERWEVCIIFIIAAAFIDALDGGAARLLRATSTFGAQLDSLSDFVCFGVVPALLLYIWGLHEIKTIGWAACLFYAICCMLRLARFNTALVEKKPLKWQKSFFTGVPSPAGGLLVLLPVILAVETNGNMILNPWLVAVYTVLVGILMVSRLPTFSLKGLRIKPELVIGFMVLCAFILVALIVEPWETMLFLGLCYLASIPISVRIYKKMEKTTHAAVSSPESSGQA